MTTLFENETAAQAGGDTATGRVVRVIGPVVDVEFGRNSIPDLYNALTTQIESHDFLAELFDVAVIHALEEIPRFVVRAGMSSAEENIVGKIVARLGHPAFTWLRAIFDRASPRMTFGLRLRLVLLDADVALEARARLAHDTIMGAKR